MRRRVGQLHVRIFLKFMKGSILSPLPIEFQQSWLIAYNDGLFDQLNFEDIPLALSKIAQEIKKSTLSLENQREEWKNAVKGWLDL